MQDILGELAPRLTSLEKQARKAREYEQVQADLHVLLREWYGFHWHRVQADVVQQRMVVKAQEERLSQARNNTLKVDSSISEIRKNLNEMREKFKRFAYPIGSIAFPKGADEPGPGSDG